MLQLLKRVLRNKEWLKKLPNPWSLFWSLWSLWSRQLLWSVWSWQLKCKAIKNMSKYRSYNRSIKNKNKSAKETTNLLLILPPTFHYATAASRACLMSSIKSEASSSPTESLERNLSQQIRKYFCIFFFSDTWWGCLWHPMRSSPSPRLMHVSLRRATLQGTQSRPGTLPESPPWGPSGTCRTPLGVREDRRRSFRSGQTSKKPRWSVTGLSF